MCRDGADTNLHPAGLWFGKSDSNVPAGSICGHSVSHFHWGDTHISTRFFLCSLELVFWFLFRIRKGTRKSVIYLSAFNVAEWKGNHFLWLVRAVPAFEIPGFGARY